MATRLPGQVRGDAAVRKSPLSTGAGTTDLPLYFRLAYLSGFAGQATTMRHRVAVTPPSDAMTAYHQLLP